MSFYTDDKSWWADLYLRVASLCVHMSPTLLPLMRNMYGRSQEDKKEMTKRNAQKELILSFPPHPSCLFPLNNEISCSIVSRLLLVFLQNNTCWARCENALPVNFNLHICYREITLIPNWPLLAEDSEFIHALAYFFIRCTSALRA